MKERRVITGELNMKAKRASLSGGDGEQSARDRSDGGLGLFGAAMVVFVGFCLLMLLVTVVVTGIQDYREARRVPHYVNIIVPEEIPEGGLVFRDPSEDELREAHENHKSIIIDLRDPQSEALREAIGEPGVFVVYSSSQFPWRRGNSDG